MGIDPIRRLTLSIDVVYCFVCTAVSVWLITLAVGSNGIPGVAGILGAAASMMWTMWNIAALYHRARRQVDENPAQTE